MDKGILLIALGKHYSKLAFNMAKSIKQYNDISISCITDETESFLLTEYDNIIRPQLSDYLEGYMKNPFYLKTKIYDLTPYEHTIYLDVDGIALKDLSPLFAYKFKIQEVAKYNYSTSDDCQMVWVNKIGKKLTDLYDAYELPHERDYPEYNSSIIIFNKSIKNEKYFTKARENYLDRRLPFKPIGGMYPDELAWNLTSAQLQQYSEAPHIKPIHFDWENKGMPIGDISKKYYILGLAGGFHYSKVVHLYEQTVKQFSPYWKWISKEKIFHKNK